MTIRIVMADVQEEQRLIKEYFNKGFTYEEIVEFLSKNHSLQMSIATLKRRIKQYGLQRRNIDYDVNVVREKIVNILDGPGCMGGYRHVWHTLKLQGISVPRSVVWHLVKLLDPEGVKLRKAHRLRRRTLS